MANRTFDFIASLTLPATDRSAGAQRRLLVLRRDRPRSPSAGSSCRRLRASGSRTSRRTSNNVPPPLLPRPGAANLRPVRIDEIIAAKAPTFSVEFFPPKTEEGREGLLATARSLRELEPDFVSVTYGAGGSTRDGTVEITRELKDGLGYETMAHLSCVGETADGLAQTLDQIEAAGIENDFALRGDPPRGQEDFVQPEGGLGSAAELTAFIGSRWPFTVGGACFPEVHPEAPDLETDLAYLKTKVEAGASFLITQLFFDNQVYFDFVAAARAAGIEVPILAGVIPVGSFAQTTRICEPCEASIPAPLEEAFQA